MIWHEHYLGSSNEENEAASILALLEEFETGVLPSYYDFGQHHKVRELGAEFIINDKTPELYCKLLHVDISKYSLEMQIWWRDRQEIDKNYYK